MLGSYVEHRSSHFHTVPPTTESGKSQRFGILGIDSAGIKREAFYSCPLNTRSVVPSLLTLGIGIGYSLST